MVVLTVEVTGAGVVVPRRRGGARRGGRVEGAGVVTVVGASVSSGAASVCMSSSSSSGLGALSREDICTARTVVGSGVSGSVGGGVEGRLRSMEVYCGCRGDEISFSSNVSYEDSSVIVYLEQESGYLLNKP